MSHKAHRDVSPSKEVWVLIPPGNGGPFSGTFLKTWRRALAETIWDRRLRSVHGKGAEEMGINRSQFVDGGRLSLWNPFGEVGSHSVRPLG